MQTVNMKQARALYRRNFSIQITEVDHVTGKERRHRRWINGARGFREYVRSNPEMFTQRCTPVGKLAQVLAGQP